MWDDKNGSLVLRNEPQMRCKDKWHKEFILKFQRFAGKPPNGRRWNRSWRRRLLSGFDFHADVLARVMAAEIEKEENDRILNDLVNMVKLHWDTGHTISGVPYPEYLKSPCG